MPTLTMNTAIVLCAGTSTRMGRLNKLLQPWGPHTIIREVVTQILHSKYIDDIIVVTGYQSERINQEIGDLPIRFCHNDDYHKGHIYSLRVGIGVLSDRESSFTVCLGDMPLIKARHYDLIMEHYQYSIKTKLPIVRPEVHDVPGHPVVFHSKYISDFLNGPEPKSGQEIINVYHDQYQTFITEEMAFVQDIDSTDDYSRWK